MLRSCSAPAISVALLSVILFFGLIGVAEAAGGIPKGVGAAAAGLGIAWKQSMCSNSVLAGS